MLDHVEHGGDEPEVGRDGSLQREQRQNALVHLQVEAVDHVVVGDHHLGELDVLMLDRLAHAVDRARDHVEPAERLLLEPRHLLLEVDAVPELVHQPTLPVTYASVRESDGVVKIFSVSSYSTIWPTRPSSSESTSTVKNAVLSETRAACCMLCVTITIE